MTLSLYLLTGTCSIFSLDALCLTASSIPPDTQRVAGETLDVLCQEGYRAAPSPFNASVSCSDPRRYQITCVGSEWASTWRCMPVTCPAFLSADPHVFTISPPTPTEFEEAVTVECEAGYRPGSRDAAAGRSFTVQCRADCSYTAQLPACTAVTCPELRTPAFTAAVAPWLSGEGAVATAVPADNRFAMVHQDQVSFACAPDYTLPARNCSHVFSVTCVDGGLVGEEQCTAALVGSGCGPCSPDPAALQPGAQLILGAGPDDQVA